MGGETGIGGLIAEILLKLDKIDGQINVILQKLKENESKSSPVTATTDFFSRS